MKKQNCYQIYEHYKWWFKNVSIITNKILSGSWQLDFNILESKIFYFIHPQNRSEVNADMLSLLSLLSQNIMLRYTWFIVCDVYWRQAFCYFVLSQSAQFS